jgi:hypothetical protein
MTSTRVNLREGIDVSNEIGIGFEMLSSQYFLELFDLSLKLLKTILPRDGTYGRVNRYKLTHCLRWIP